MYKYNPQHAPDAAEWLALDEQERMTLVEAYHRKLRIKLPNLTLHATIHSIVENQIAEGHAPVIRAMTRLTAAGLSRHDAVHAIGSVLATHLVELLKTEPTGANPMVGYDAAIERLTAESWRRG
ncbi:MAG TPA: hypothetical protein VF292_12945 [Rhodanobacteraceae bacterium]